MTPYRIIISPRASAEYKEIFQYVTSNFGKKKAKEVEEHYAGIVGQIAVNPFQFPYFSKRKGIRKCVVSQQTTLYYRFDKNVVNLFSFRSNFMNPRTRSL